MLRVLFVAALLVPSIAVADVAPEPADGFAADVVSSVFEPAGEGGTLIVTVEVENDTDGRIFVRFDGGVAYRGGEGPAYVEAASLEVAGENVGFEMLPMGPHTKRFSERFAIPSDTTATAVLRFPLTTTSLDGLDARLWAHAINGDITEGERWLGGVSVDPFDDVTTRRQETPSTPSTMAAPSTTSQAEPADDDGGCAAGGDARSSAFVVLVLVLLFRRR